MMTFLNFIMALNLMFGCKYKESQNVQGFNYVKNIFSISYVGLNLLLEVIKDLFSFGDYLQPFYKRLGHFIINNEWMFRILRLVLTDDLETVE